MRFPCLSSWLVACWWNVDCRSVVVLLVLRPVVVYELQVCSLFALFSLFVCVSNLVSSVGLRRCLLDPDSLYCVSCHTAPTVFNIAVRRCCISCPASIKLFCTPRHFILGSFRSSFLTSIVV